MNLKITGEFIAQMRKKQKLTQVQLALKIGVSEKTISKWECGKGFPDTSLILPLCEVLKVSANELLSGKLLNQEEYKQKAEANIINLANDNFYKNKLLLMIEWVVGGFSVLTLLVASIIASYVQMPDYCRVLTVVAGLLLCMIGVAFSVVIEKDAGFYECKNCHHTYIPGYKEIIGAMHMGRTRYLKCPKCGKKSWSKKTLKNNN